MAFILANRASGRLAAAATPTDTVLLLQSGNGAAFPVPSGGNVVRLAIENALGAYELVDCTARTGDQLTVVRAREGTTAQSWASGDRVELRLTAGVMASYVEKAAPTITATMTCNSNDIVDVGTLNATAVAASTVRGNVYRAADNGAANQLAIPNGGGPATLGGVRILTVSDLPVGVIVMWSGSVASIPPRWRLCDGSAGTPDLRDRFIVGAGGSLVPGNTGGSTAKTTSDAGGHTHTIDGTVLTVDQLPPHTHPGGPYSRDDDQFGSGTRTPIAVGKRPDGSAGSAVAQFSVATVGGGQPHTHTAQPVAGHTHAIADARPPYYALCYIMYVGA